MFLIRAVETKDLQDLFFLSKSSGFGFTTLPSSIEHIEKKINLSIKAFSDYIEDSVSNFYWLVLEDVRKSKVVGCSGICSSVGLNDVFYHYRITRESHHCASLDVHSSVNVLSLCNDYTGSSELCSLFLLDEYRGMFLGKLLSKSRFLFLANFPKLFGSKVIAELRGVSDDKGYSPFYSWLQDLFLHIDFSKADYLCGIGDKSFIAELMPRHPVFLDMLPKSAQEVIGEVHPDTRPALSMLQKEGFLYNNYIDIFDAGPTVECDISDINTVSSSKVLKVKIINNCKGKKVIISNMNLQGFTSALVAAEIDEFGDCISLSKENADLLKLTQNDDVRVAII